MILCEFVDLACSCIFAYGTRTLPDACGMLNSALPMLHWHILYIPYCSRELEPDFVCFYFFLIGCHRNISTALVQHLNPLTSHSSFFSA